MTPRTLTRSLSVICAAAVLAACGGDGPTDDDSAPADDTGEGIVEYPITVTNCDTEFTFDSAPDSVLVLGRGEIFHILYDLGVAETVVARAGAFPTEYYDGGGAAAIEAVPSLGDDLDDSGHLQISQEAILDTDPDLAIGLPDGIDRAGLDDAGIPVLDQPANCPAGIDDISYEDIYDQVEMYGRIFDRTERAAEIVADLAERIAAVESSASDVGAGRDIAILYPTVGGGTAYAYGNLSMSHEQVTTAGFTNVFADTDERVFEVTAEELISRDPDVLILLHSDGEPGPVEDAVRNLPGAEGITAVREGAILTQLFGFGEYASPLVVDGLERIVAEFGGD